MKNKITYYCENCGKDFENYSSCEQHETKCANLHNKFRENVQKAVSLAKRDFSDIIENISFKTDEEIDFYIPSSEYELYKFEITCTLKNGNTLSVCDGMDEYLHLGNYLETEIIYKSLSREIKNRIPTIYEGIIKWEYVDGWRTNFIDNIELDNIVDRLNGRKVKIEIIE